MRYISIDTETYDPLLSESGPSWTHGEGHIIVTGLYDATAQRKGYKDGNGGQTVRDFLLSAEVTLIGANLQYDIGFLLYEHKLQCNEMKCGLIDVQIVESLIDEYQPYALGDLAKKYLNEVKGSGNLPVMAKKYGNRDFRKYLKDIWDDSEEGREEIRNYVVSDADQPARIWEQQRVILESQDLMPAFEMNMGVLRSCIKMKQRGVRINYAQWLENCKMVQPIHAKLEFNFEHKYGNVNINSSKQLGEFMLKHQVPYKTRITIRGWEPEGRKYQKKTDEFQGKQLAEQKKILKEDFPTIRLEKNKLRLYVDQKYAARTAGQLTAQGYNVIASANIDKYFLAEHKGTYPVVAGIVELKQVKNIMQKFLGEKFGRFIVFHKDTNEYRIHPTFNPVGARQTGRMSGSTPNLQQIPSKTVLFAGTPHEVDLAVMCREVFVPDRGCLWYKLDESGQELRMAAHFAPGSNGDYIRKLYNENPYLDEHQFVADVSGLIRKIAKNLRFGLGYGLGIASMSRMFGFPVEECQELVDKIRDASPWFIDLMKAVQETVKKRGYIKTLLGRRVHMKRGLEDKLYPFLNYLIQGSSSDQTKTAVVSIDRTETVERQALIVHDEVDGSLPMTPEGFKRLNELQRDMEHAIELRVPSISEPEIGSSWAHLESRREDETMEDWWDRICDTMKEGRNVNVRTFDLEVLDEEEDDDESEEDL